jgi:hypothetical protein
MLDATSLIARYDISDRDVDARLLGNPENTDIANPSLQTQDALRAN